jgi:superfamily II DNA or RNA helicase
MHEFTRWPHQLRGLERWQDAYDRGVKRACLACPTGGGKTLMMRDVIVALVALGRRVSLLSNRKVLLDQLRGDLVDLRVDHGVRAAGHEPELDQPVQLCSLQTEVSRVLKRGQWPLHTNQPGDVAIFDEGHLHTVGHVVEYRRRVLAAGGRTLDVTATPIGMGNVADELIVAASNSELRACSAHLYIEHFAPDEPESLRGKSAPADGEDLTANQQRAVMGAVDENGEANAKLHGLYGRIWDNFEKINPDHDPFICFGPGVRESLWIAQQFTAKGVRTAHIDGEHIWLDGELHRRTAKDELWQEVLAESEAGTIKGLCCRFVLREGFNAPWLRHGIMATVFGSVGSYLQAGGRLSRYQTGYASKTLQDHGGNFWRHGSLNIDRAWTLDDTPNRVYAKRADRIREKRERAPVVCPQCNRVLTRRECPCGFVVTTPKLPRAVVTHEGTLTRQTGDYFPERRRSTMTSGDIIGRWVVTWKRACSAKWYATYPQAEAFFAYENHGFYPNRAWPLFPIDDNDFYRCVLDVPVDRLRGSPELLARMGAYQERQLAKAEERDRGIYSE